MQDCHWKATDGANCSTNPALQHTENVRIADFSDIQVFACMEHADRLAKMADLFQSGEDLNDLLALTWTELLEAWEAL